MDEDFLQEFCVCRAEFENDEVIWGDGTMELSEDENSLEITIQEKYKDELLEDIPY